MLQDKIDAYLRGELSEEESQKWQHDLSKDQKLLNDMRINSDIEAVLKAQQKHQIRQFWKEVLEETEEEAEIDEPTSLQIVSSKTDSSKQTRRLGQIPSFLRIAAIVLIGLGLYSILMLFMPAPVNMQQLAMQHLNEIDDYSTVMVGSQRGTRVVWQDVVTKYKIGDYEEVLQLLKNETGTNLPTQKKQKLLSALCYVQLSQAGKAIPILEEVIVNKDTTLDDEARWFLALAYIQNSEINKAKKTLEDISTQEGAWQRKRAQTLLDQLQ